MSQPKKLQSQAGGYPVVEVETKEKSNGSGRPCPVFHALQNRNSEYGKASAVNVPASGEPG